jgi:SAM-dependent methyltransferase
MSQQERWQLSGGGPESYERYQVPSVFEPLARVFLDHVNIMPGHRLLDVACGTGVVARLAAPMVGASGKVAGIDLNAGMVEVAAQHAPTAGPTVEWRQGDAESLPFEDSAFDFVLCQQGLQFMPDKTRALQEMHRVLAPGGLLALCVWKSIEHSPCNMATAQSLKIHIGERAAKMLHAPFALGDADLLHDLIEGAGFCDIEMRTAEITRRMLPPEESIPGHLASTPVGPEIVALDEATRDTLVEEIGGALAAYRDAKGLAIPQGTHIALARKSP